MIHELKTWPEYFTHILAGTKTFEYRANDRNFSVGDILRLREWDPKKQEYTSREVLKSVTYILETKHLYRSYHCLDGVPYCVLALNPANVANQLDD